MRRDLRALALGVAAVAVAAAERPGLAAEPAAGTWQYTVKDGEGCGEIVRGLLGDDRWLDLFHQANPQLGPRPHHLQPGTVVNIPPLPPGAPDARVTFARNRVEVRAGTVHTARPPDDPLFRGNRVTTGDASSAGIVFRDDTRLVLGDDTLVVIFGDTSGAATRSSTSLLTGALRARAGSLAGKKPVGIASSAASVAMKEGEAQVTVDPRRTTRLAVYKGASQISAQKRTVDVAGGFGSKAELGRVPTPPRPLPAAPVFEERIAPLVLSLGPAAVSARYATPAGSQAPPAARWHVQLAHDADFEDLQVDARVPLDVVRLEGRDLPAGTYHARVSAIDADEFEGPFSEDLAFEVGIVALDRPDQRYAFAAIFPPTLRCALDGGPLQAMGAPFAIDRSRDLHLRCASGAAGSADVALALPRVAAPTEPPAVAALPPSPPPPPAPRAPTWGVDVDLLGLASVVGGEAGGGLGASAGFWARARGVDLGIGVRGSREGRSSVVDGTLTAHSLTAFSLPLSAGLTWGPWTAYAAVSPMVALDQASGASTATLGGASFALGARVRFQRATLFVEPSFRKLNDAARSPVAADGTGPVVSAGVGVSF